MKISSSLVGRYSDYINEFSTDIINVVLYYICINLQNENLILKTSLSFKNICDCCLIKLIS